MATGQSPKVKGRAIGLQAQMAYEGLIARQNALQKENEVLIKDHARLLESIEEDLDMGEALTGNPPTHSVDTDSWNVVEVIWASPDADPRLSPAPSPEAIVPDNLPDLPKEPEPPKPRTTRKKKPT